MSTALTDSGPPKGVRRPGRWGRVIVAVAIAVGVGIAGAGTYVFLTDEFGGTTLVIYTYPSLFGGLDCGNATAFSDVFGTFASAHHVHIVVDCPAGTLYSSLVRDASAPVADLVIGLDEITAPQAEAAHLLVPYAPAGLANVAPYLASELSPDAAAVPYEYGYLALDYNASFYNVTGGAIAHTTLPDLVANRSWASTFLVEDPTLDITGEEFLLWEIEYYTNVLHQNWTTFWTQAGAGLPPVATSWGQAFSQFQAGADQVVVSYSTDPAYAAYYGQVGAFNSTGSWWGGSDYSWRTVYGIGIVNGTRHLALDQQFENWFLSSDVESLIPTSEWEYPANDTVPVPSAYYAYALPPSGLVALNNDTTPSTIESSLPGWLATWASIAS